MTVFKAFLNVLKSNIVLVVIYTIILISFAGFNMKTENKQFDFNATKPDIFVVNDDESDLSDSLFKYLENNSNIIELENDDEAIDDAIFYRDINYFIHIPENFEEDFLNGKNPKIEVKSTKDYNASLAEMMLNRYLKIAESYKGVLEKDEYITKIEDTLKTEVSINVTSSLNKEGLSSIAYFYNFANYSILAGSVYVVCMIISSFKKETIKKRTIISSMNYKKLNRKLMLSNGLFVVVLWVIYVILSFIFVGKSMFSIHGLLYMLNSLLFTFASLAIAFLIGNLVKSKEAISGIVNVVALGSSFLCGAFVPIEFLPKSVKTIAHILPSFYYIDTNNYLATLENITLKTLNPILINSGVILLFIIIFIVITNVISSKKRTVN